MLLPINASMLEACVLSVLSREDTYGYKLTQALTEKTGVSESSLYPVLRRLQKSGALTTYDENFSGRNRRYYQLSADGRRLLHAYRREWSEYKRSIDELLLGQSCEKCQMAEMDGGEPA
ncbi:MAG: PadR family transcriptional regulator [Christensenellaceae bacterium]|nr:PadR family transcriptional regulator [Christensenellaceae bacterium]